QVRPEFVWFELRPQPGNDAPVPMTVRNVDDVLGYPAPTWRLEAPAWPRRALPVARAWGRESSPLRDSALSTPLRHLADDPLDGFVKREARVASEEVRELEVTFEKVDVEDRPGVVSPKQPAMVVRLRHPAGSPVLAQLEGLGRGQW